ncbi:MAG TPA: PD-(D/E)XK nuclease family protein [Candidatus Binataceae bacterium]|nr:PD-(D/E)XK nuclease family protein [Candidatus Binataceae bacterium]
MPASREIVISPRAAYRIAKARAFVEAAGASGEMLVVSWARESADDLVRAHAAARGASAGIHRMSLNRLVGLLAADRMAEAGLAPAAGLAAEAIAARAVFRLAPSGALAHFAPIFDRPGFAGALARTIEELRLNDVSPEALRSLGGAGEAIAAMLAQFEAELAAARLIDRAGMLALATDAVRADPPRFAALATLLLDVAIDGARELKFISALAARAPQIFATCPAADTRTASMLSDALGTSPALDSPPSRDEPSSLIRLQEHLFRETTPAERTLDETVAIISAPGEMHECVEIARRILAEARRGVRFDRIAVLLRDPVRYAPYLEETFDRAGIPAYFARGSRRPEPAGRALVALLACAAEDLSARRFAEYLSLAQVADEGESRDAPAALSSDSELHPAPLGTDLEPARAAGEADSDAGATEMPTAPWRWERLLSDAAVIGSAARWERRLDGLEHELRRRRVELSDDDARAGAIDRQLGDLAHLKRVALPIVSALAALPEKAVWSEWLALLRALTDLAIRDREPVLAALAELEPMGPVGPAGLDEVRLVLGERLGRLERPPSRRRYGAVFVASPARARGMSFDVVIVPGLAERGFPRKLTEDPILPDAARKRLGAHLMLIEDRSEAERLALRLGAGAAENRAMFTYPRVDLEQGRPRVPSFYALEILRAAEGRLPGFDELARRAACEQAMRLGWPAPASPEDAIDDAEFDLAILDKLVGVDADATVGAANYLLGANEHLARALRGRARRWLKRWTGADGLVDPDPPALGALARHQIAARSYSPTGLQNFASCPYRFFLQAIHRLAPREEIEALEVIDPLTRGALFHEVQFEVLTALRAANLLPVAAGNLAEASRMLDAVTDSVAARWREELAPAIDRVWRDGIDAIRADLGEWLRRAAEDPARWRPERFELAFGLSDRDQADPASTENPVALPGGLQLRGSIDLVERAPDGPLRVTDHKTGKVRAERGFVIGGGKTLQPVLYALAAERLLGRPVRSGRLYYCTAAGGYEERAVEIDQEARSALDTFTRTLDAALGAGFFPAAPAAGECEWCDYRRVCGPYEEQRVKIKPRTRLEALARLRTIP